MIPCLPTRSCLLLVIHDHEKPWASACLVSHWCLVWMATSWLFLVNIHCQFNGGPLLYNFRNPSIRCSFFLDLIQVTLIRHKSLMSIIIMIITYQLLCTDMIKNTSVWYVDIIPLKSLNFTVVWVKYFIYPQFTVVVSILLMSHYFSIIIFICCQFLCCSNVLSHIVHVSCCCLGRFW